MTTRMIGAIIMVHGDNSGLVLPPRIAPTQVMIIPIQQRKEGVLEKAQELKAMLSNYRVKVDDTDKSPGWKFSEREMRGIPLRVEIGPKDIEAGQAVIVRRDNGEKCVVALTELDAKVGELWEQMQKDMLERKNPQRQSHLHSNHLRGVQRYHREPSGFVKAMWCGDQACEDKIKEDTTATSRCMPFGLEKLSDKCVCCGRPAKTMVYWGKAY